MSVDLLSGLLRHDRAVVLGGLLVVAASAWTYLLLGAGIEMQMMDMGGGQIMAMSPEWTLGYGTLIFAMWAVMMVAMMLPSAAPAILLATALDRQRGATIARRRSALFASGYLLVWFGFSLAATLLQAALDDWACYPKQWQPAIAPLLGACSSRLVFTSGRRLRMPASLTAARQSNSWFATGAMAASARSSPGCGTACSVSAAAGC